MQAARRAGNCSLRKNSRDFDREAAVSCAAVRMEWGDDLVTDKELEFCVLCGPLEDALEMLDNGDTAGARAVLERVVLRARELCDQERRAQETGGGR